MLTSNRPSIPVMSDRISTYILGLGGREIKTEGLLEALRASCTAPEKNR